MSVSTTSGELPFDRREQRVAVLAQRQQLDLRRAPEQVPERLADEVRVVRDHDPQRGASRLRISSRRPPRPCSASLQTPRAVPAPSGAAAMRYKRRHGTDGGGRDAAGVVVREAIRPARAVERQVRQTSELLALRRSTPCSARRSPRAPSTGSRAARWSSARSPAHAGTARRRDRVGPDPRRGDRAPAAEIVRAGVPQRVAESLVAEGVVERSVGRVLAGPDSRRWSPRARGSRRRAAHHPHARQRARRGARRRRGRQPGHGADGRARARQPAARHGHGPAARQRGAVADGRRDRAEPGGERRDRPPEPELRGRDGRRGRDRSRRIDDRLARAARRAFGKRAERGPDVPGGASPA